MTGLEAALASGLLSVAENKLTSLLCSEFASITGVKKDLSELQDIHTEIRTWLSAVSGRAIESDPSLRWVMKLKDIANDIYDLLDEVFLEDEKHKIESDYDKHAMAEFFSAEPKFLQIQCKVPDKIKEIKVKFDAIVKQRSNADIIVHEVYQPAQCKNKATGEKSLLINVEESKIPSRDRVKGEIVSKILESNKREDGRIVSIVGLGGCGKTTLAQHICHDDKIKSHFNGMIFWVHVSHEFCRDKLTGKLFEAITDEKSDIHAQQHMLCAISKKLSGKKFLLVLDDAWHEDRHDWGNFMALLSTGASGSKVLLTTRNQNVAKVVESNYVFRLAFLSDNESWSFFLKSSGWAEEDLDNAFIQVGKDIVKKCGGVPLAIETLGSVLFQRMEINSWKAIREGNLWDESNMEGRVFASLKWSYIYLKDHLKQCFVFCSIFPKGCTINKDYLIDQWMSHGLIKLKEEDLPQDIGNEYFDSLMKTGFLHGPVEAWPEKHVKCKMHYLIHDLSHYILQNEVVTSLPKNITTDCSQKCRYLSLTSCSERVERDLLDKVRAIYVSGGNPLFDNLDKKSFNMRSVVLDYAIDTLFPQFVLKLEHLGYLEIHHINCTELPEAISGCWNMQSLRFISCKGFTTLPKSIGNLKKLRTLDLKCIADLKSLPQSIGNCRYLESLQLSYCQKLTDIPSSVGRLGNLRVLHILRCSSLQQLQLDCNGEFSNLKTVNLHGCQNLQDLPSTFPCRTLRTLYLSETKVTVLPQWVTSMSSLECIDLMNCKELVELPEGLADLKNLEVLNVAGCRKLLYMPSGFGQLTRLKVLGLFAVGCGGDGAQISDLENLDMISGRMEITNLKYLKDPIDAEKAMLKRKNIRRLELDWSSSKVEEELLSDVEQDHGVFSALEPPPQISYLKICRYRGHCLPRWLTMMKQNDSSYGTDLMCKQTSPCQFLSLANMTLEEFPSLKYIQGLMELPALKSLYLLKMANLEELWTTTSGFEIQEEEIGERNCFPVLSEMCITGCPKLNVKPYFPKSLGKLCLQDSNEQLLSSDSFNYLPSCNVHSAVHHLRELQLKEMTGSSSSWEFLQHHTELVILHIECCNDLTQLPTNIRNLKSLHHLRIRECWALQMLPEWLGELHTLRSLEVSVTPLIDRLPESAKHLTSLVSLHICRWDKLEQLPDVIQHLTSLEHINLGLCRALTVLPEWIGQLSALRKLWIQYCSGLQCLPQSIQRFTALQDLYIVGSPGFARRYENRVGPDWHLVSRIHSVRIYDMDI